MRGLALLLGMIVFIPLPVTCFLYKGSAFLLPSPLLKQLSSMGVQERTTGQPPIHRTHLTRLQSDPWGFSGNEY
jgi:hypothetical protein